MVVVDSRPTQPEDPRSQLRGRETPPRSPALPLFRPSKLMDVLLFHFFGAQLFLLLV